MTLIGLGAVALVACSRVAPADVSEEVERICAAFCEQNVACHEPELFETVDDCFQVCFHEYPSMHELDECGEATRALYDCVGSTQSCEEYLDTNNIGADDYACKAEKESRTLACNE